MSTETLNAAAELHAFGQAYDYDVSYLIDLLEASPPTFEAFEPARGMSDYRWALPLDAHFVARVATMLGEDCGPCTQLNLGMALEAGVDRELLRCMLERPEGLAPHLRDVRDHALATARGETSCPDRVERLRARFGAEGFAELALAIVGSRLFPTLKRALGRDGVCQTPTVDF